ncbi:MAG: hypothetical protein P8177_06080 [Gemmatimonadota bacterium]
MERWIQDAARDYNDPPETPREAMWAEVRAGLEAQGRAGTHDPDVLELDARRAGRRADRLRRWTPWGLGLAAAAALAIGFGLGRLTQESPAPESVAATAGTAAASGAATRPSLPLRLTAADHMGEAEVLLTMFRSSDREGDRAATAMWARDLLSTTRLLLDSRVAEDPEMALLLSDLELVLVQITSAGTAEGTEQELIEEGIEQRQLLAKLRTAATPPVAMEM